MIFGVFEESKTPLVWCLLQNKGTGIYRRMLQIVSRKLQREDMQLKINEIIGDFELGFKVRYNKMFFFHLFKEILSKGKDLGLSTPYKNDKRLNQFIRKLIAIGFLPEFYVHQKLHRVLQEASTR